MARASQSDLPATTTTLNPSCSDHCKNWDLWYTSWKWGYMVAQGPLPQNHFPTCPIGTASSWKWEKPSPHAYLCTESNLFLVASLPRKGSSSSQNCFCKPDLCREQNDTCDITYIHIITHLIIISYMLYACIFTCTLMCMEEGICTHRLCKTLNACPRMSRLSATLTPQVEEKNAHFSPHNLLLICVDSGWIGMPLPENTRLSIQPMGCFSK